MKGSNAFNDGFWQGYEGKDFEGVVDLGSQISIKKISIGFIQNNNSWIFFPQSVSFSVSADGVEYKSLETIQNQVSVKDAEVRTKDFATEKGCTARFIKIETKSILKCPEWHPGAGGACWLFVDEITIE